MDYPNLISYRPVTNDPGWTLPKQKATGCIMNQTPAPKKPRGRIDLTAGAVLGTTVGDALGLPAGVGFAILCAAGKL
jgi:hypothetical protein